VTSRIFINPLPKNSGVSLRATIQNPRPRKYASDADRQKAFRERQAMIQIRVAPKAIETFDEIAETLGYSRQEVVYALLMKGLMSLGNWETVGLPVDWQRKMPQFKLPRYEENPTMRKATPAQLAARERFAEMARSGAFKRKATPAQLAARERFAECARSGALKRRATKARNLSKKVDLQAWMDEYERLEQENMHSENAVRLADLLGTKTDQQIARQIVKNHERLGYLDDDDYDRRRAIYKRLMPKLERLLEPKSNPAKKTVSQKISQLVREGYPQKQAVAIALSEESKGKVRKNPAEAKERKPRVVLITNPAKKALGEGFYLVSIKRTPTSKWVPYHRFHDWRQAEDYSHFLAERYPNWTIRMHDTRAM